MSKPLNIQLVRKGMYLLFSMFLLIGSSGFSVHQSPPQSLSCVITSLQCTGNGQGSVSFSWSAVSGASSYKAYWIRLSDGQKSNEVTIFGTSHTFSGLTSGSYRFYFAPDCGDGTLEYITDDVIIM